MKGLPVKKAKAATLVPFEPVRIVKRSYRPDQMTDEQRASMDQAAADVLVAYQVFRQSIVAALTAEHTHCGSWSSESHQLAVSIDNAVKSFAKNISSNPIQWPVLPTLLVVQEHSKAANHD